MTPQQAVDAIHQQLAKATAGASTEAEIQNVVISAAQRANAKLTTKTEAPKTGEQTAVLPRPVIRDLNSELRRAQVAADIPLTGKKAPALRVSGEAHPPEPEQIQDLVTTLGKIRGIADPRALARTVTEAIVRERAAQGMPPLAKAGPGEKLPADQPLPVVAKAKRTPLADYTNPEAPKETPFVIIEAAKPFKDSLQVVNKETGQETALHIEKLGKNFQCYIGVNPVGRGFSDVLAAKIYAISLAHQDLQSQEEGYTPRRGPGRPANTRRPTVSYVTSPSPEAAARITANEARMAELKRTMAAKSTPPPAAPPPSEEAVRLARMAELEKMLAEIKAKSQ
jgi:hypothetical protein